ncbi:MAG TPA: PAS domain-containing protein [Opitutaceae bacterium]|jgi:PAS domain S-box-containing protein|nr:PAS domain-containing protein [Opitutaceae bacterium]
MISIQDSPPLGARKSPPGRAAPAGAVPVVGVGASALGLHACSALLAGLPEDLGMAVVLVPHVPPRHFPALTAYLGTVTPLPVQAVQGEIALRPNTIFVTPPGGAFVYAGGCLRPEPDPAAPIGRIDVFFRSLAEARGRRAIGVLLAGSATDGNSGLHAIRRAGGKTFADRPERDQVNGAFESPAAQVMGAEEIGEELGRAGQSFSTPAGRLAAANHAAYAPQEDLQNLLASVPLAVVLTARDQSIRRFTPKAAELFGLSAADIGGPFPPVRAGPHLAGMAQAIGIAMDSGVAIESLACNYKDRWFSLTIRPCRARGGKRVSNGAVIALADIQALKEGERGRQAALNRASDTFNAVRGPLLILDGGLRVMEANDAFCGEFHVDRPAAEGKNLCALAPGLWNGAPLVAALTRLLEDHMPFDGVEVHCPAGTGAARVFLTHGRSLAQLPDDPRRVLVGFSDVTDRRRIEAERGRVAAAVLAAQEINRRVLNSSADCIQLMGIDGRILFINSPCLALLEIEDSTAWIGRPWAELWPPSAQAHLLQTISTALAGSSARFHSGARTTKGSWKYWDVIVSPILDEHGTAVQLVSISREVTEQVEAQEALRRHTALLAAVVEAVPEGIAVVDGDGRVRHANSRFAALPHPAGDPAAPPPNAEGGGVSQVLAEDGRCFERLGAPLPIEGAPSGWIWALHDITRLKGIEAELTRAHQRVHSYAQSLEIELAQRQSKLEFTERELERYSYGIMHDLRAPLRSIVSYAEMLQQEWVEQLGETGRAYLARIFSAASRLDSLIKDLLSYTVSANGPLALETVDVAALVEELIAEFPPFQRPLTLIDVCAPLLPVKAHAAALAQCLTHLLFNAVKFVAPGIVPRMKIRTEAFGGQVRIWCEDNGIGLAPADCERIFQLFSRVNPPSLYAGTGVGLAVVRRNAEWMGGSAGAQPGATGGSRFWVQLPQA